MYRRQGSRPSSGKRNAKVKMVAEEALQIAAKRREATGKGEKVYPFECRVPKNSKER